MVIYYNILYIVYYDIMFQVKFINGYHRINNVKRTFELITVIYIIIYGSCLLHCKILFIIQYFFYLYLFYNLYSKLI